jgi:NAD(P)-dependent dehydrogenase (short-subunit alcohol dehydrogenase family)
MATSASQISSGKDLLRGKTTVVTGAGRGLGRAIATVFAHAGACSVFIVRDRSAGEQMVEELNGQGYKADVGVADITDPAQISSLVLDLSQRHPSIDVLVNNAGIFLDEDRKMHPSNIDTTILEQTLNVNLFGPIRVNNAFLPYVARTGRIINVSSTMGQLAGDSDGYGPSYSMSKVALNMYTQLLAADLRDRRIMVDAFHPGWAKTDMGGPRATVEPEDSAQTALFLATRPLTDKTGLFWQNSEVIDW